MVTCFIISVMCILVVLGVFRPSKLDYVIVSHSVIRIFEESEAGGHVFSSLIDHLAEQIQQS